MIGQRTSNYRLAVVGLVAVLSGCAGNPASPDWMLTAVDASRSATAAFFSGNDQLERYEFAKARSEVARTGKADLVARVELARCAARLASLVMGACPGFERLQEDVGPAERAYAAFLTRPLAVSESTLLPTRYGPLAAATSDAARAAALRGIADPFSRLIAAAVLVRDAHGTPEILSLAVDTASENGWRRPLLAWLGVSATVAERNGQTMLATGLRRRMALVIGDQ